MRTGKRPAEARGVAATNPPRPTRSRMRVRPTPIRRDARTVTLRRVDYDRLLRRLEDLEDATRIREAMEHPETRDYLPAPLVDRLMAGEHPVRIWREHRGLTLAALAEKSSVGLSYIQEIESKKKPGSVRALKALAQALQVDLDDLVP